MQGQNRELANAGKLFAVGVILLAVVFLIPDAGYVEHKSFFAIASQSAWHQLWEWPAAWCSVKIILLGAGLLILVDAMLSLMMQSEHHAICVALFLLAILPMLLGLFGFYELVKAVL